MVEPNFESLIQVRGYGQLFGQHIGIELCSVHTEQRLGNGYRAWLLCWDGLFGRRRCGRRLDSSRCGGLLDRAAQGLLPGRGR
jgi:hypothetical protein